jgi:hypothetical protein
MSLCGQMLPDRSAGREIIDEHTTINLRVS